MQQAPRTNSAALPNPHTSQNSNITTNPAILFNDNIPPKSRSPTAHPTSWINWIRSANKLDVRAENTSRTNGHGASIRDSAICTNQDIVTHGNVVPVVAVKWRLYDDTFAHTAKWQFHVGTRDFASGTRWLWCWTKVENLAEKSTAFFGTGAMGRVGGIVKTPDSCYTVLAVLGKRWACWVVIEAFQHFLTFGVLFSALW